MSQQYPLHLYRSNNEEDIVIFYLQARKSLLQGETIIENNPFSF